MYTFPTVGGGTVQNLEVVATKDATRVDGSILQARNERRDIGIDLSHEVDRLRAEPPPTDDVPVLRDDRAPVDSLLDPMVGQRYVVQRAPTNGTSTPSPALAPPTHGVGLAPAAARASGV